MKKICDIFLINLFLFSHTYAENLNITYVCEWKDGISEKNIKIVYKINRNKEIFEDDIKINTIYLSLTNNNIEYKYSKFNNLNVNFNHHFKLNINSGKAFEIITSDESDYSDVFTAACTFI